METHLSPMSEESDHSQCEREVRTVCADALTGVYTVLQRFGVDRFEEQRPLKLCRAFNHLFPFSTYSLRLQ